MKYNFKQPRTVLIGDFDALFGDYFNSHQREQIVSETIKNDCYISNYDNISLITVNINEYLHAENESEIGQLFRHNIGNDDLETSLYCPSRILTCVNYDRWLNLKLDIVAPVLGLSILLKNISSVHISLAYNNIYFDNYGFKLKIKNIDMNLMNKNTYRWQEDIPF